MLIYINHYFSGKLLEKFASRDISIAVISVCLNTSDGTKDKTVNSTWNELIINRTYFNCHLIDINGNLNILIIYKISLNEIK